MASKILAFHIDQEENILLPIVETVVNVIGRKFLSSVVKVVTKKNVTAILFRDIFQKFWKYFSNTIPSITNPVLDTVSPAILFIDGAKENIWTLIFPNVLKK